MNNIYHTICLQLIRGISKALEQMEEKDYEAAEETLRRAWRQASGDRPEGLQLR